MTIRKGIDWGTQVPRPDDLVVAASDAELASLVSAQPAGTYAVRSGDLHRTLGSPDPARPVLRRVDMDLLRVDLDGTPALAVAHVIARRSGPLGWWWGPLLGVFNAEYLGRWDPTPRGHPNDGRAEVVEVRSSMPRRARLQALRRLPSGSHLPHPDISTSHRSETEYTFDSPLDVYLDGERHGRVSRLRITVESDAYRLHI
jgi:hypothetical protein